MSNCSELTRDRYLGPGKIDPPFNSCSLESSKSAGGQKTTNFRTGTLKMPSDRSRFEHIGREATATLTQKNNTIYLGNETKVSVRCKF
ncbi:unnamed protein product [Pieris brassicae]|uniref:Uncharacterized protein n=1 Tax=Pieris brassicae TaxID=7116 RepID=A0A9P0TXB4_PIEBR|nr:unnamed protein product [Pieris brassicae]